MTLESIAGGLPFREAEAILFVEDDRFQCWDNGMGEVTGFRFGEAAEDVGGDFDHGIEHAAAEVGEGDGPIEAEDDAGAPVFALAEEEAGAGADDAEEAGGDEAGFHALAPFWDNLLDQAATCTPSSDSAWTMLRPMPCAAPVTMAEIVVRLIFGMCAALAAYVLTNAAI